MIMQCLVYLGHVVSIKYSMSDTAKHEQGLSLLTLGSLQQPNAYHRWWCCDSHRLDHQRDELIDMTCEYDFL